MKCAPLRSETPVCKTEDYQN